MRQRGSLTRGLASEIETGRVGDPVNEQGRRNGRYERKEKHSLNGAGGCEEEGDVVRILAEIGPQTSDVGSYPSRRRVSTAGAEDPLPIVRLPARNTLRNVSRESRALLFREALVDIEVTAIWRPTLKIVRVSLGVRM